MTDVTEGLKPCPFCGDDEELRVCQPAHIHGYWVVHCGACGGEMQAESRGGAIAGWNERPMHSASPTPVTEEALLECVALAIERADREPCPDYSDLPDSDEISNWGIHLARAAILAMSSMTEGVVEAYEHAAKVADYAVERAERDWSNPDKQDAVKQVGAEIAEVIRSYAALRINRETTYEGETKSE